MVMTSDKYVDNNPFLNNKIAIICPTYQGQFIFLKKSMESFKKTGAFVIGSYDRHNMIIPNDIFMIPDSWVMKHRTYGAEKRNGWLWDIIYAAGIIGYNYFSHVFLINGDCILEKPDGLSNLIKILGDADMMSSSANGTIHTCSVLFKDHTFLDFVDYIKEKLDNNIPESYSPEVLLRDFVAKGGVVNKVPPLQARYPKGHKYADAVDHYSAYNQPSTWKEVIGFRNLGGEHKAACLEHLEPVEKKYIDMREFGGFFSKHERETLYNYYWSNDRRWLYKYWAEGEDSYWNRRYNHLLYYGKEPLYDDTKRKELGPPSERLGHFDRWNYFGYVLKDEEYEKKWKEVIHGCH